MTKQFKRIAVITIVVCFFAAIISACGSSRHISLPSDVDKITVYLSGGSQTTVSYTDSEKIEKIIDYLASLSLKSATGINEQEGILLGGGWEITMFSGESACGVILIGSEYIQDPDGKWWQISAEPEYDFEDLLKSLIPDEMPDNPIFDEWK